MATLLWPATLPAAALVAGFQETPPQLTLRSSMDAGPPKVRRRFTSGITAIACTYALTREQLATLDDFFVVTTGGGSLPFLWIHPRTLQEVTVRFKEPPQYRPEDSVEVWKAVLALEVLPPGMAATLARAQAAREEQAAAREERPA